ncbi:CpsD/CapB family tyrosine-protein kinase [Clostridium sp. HMP27]|uniref:CpsD/CapB family tyrosine-protein kinase n=1 Tax=Clostridium sp. HMP27 TaxID=1487921 RepID=UPI00052D55E7|nr:CpsD/CapB family tyrosine-protein kinase [Clostridium sp. HMP27]KGK89561.1 capsular biosynthesis protein [Clostridium sp. HMP27]
MNESYLISIKNPMNPISEAYRTLRTNIKFSSFDKEIKSLVITSSGPNEGKSTTACNLAIVMAQTGSKTILIDCDQRKPSIHKVFGLSNECGLSNILADEVEFKDAVYKTQIENLEMLPSGTKPPNPSEILSSEKMKRFLQRLKEKYDSIIIDTPPIVAVTDAQLLSTYVDGCILVVASGQTDRGAAMKAKGLLDKVGAKILGVVLNKVDTSNKGYYGARYYNYYSEDYECKKRKRLFNIGVRHFG